MKIKNPTGEVITLPTGTVIDGPTEVSDGLLQHIDNRDYVRMLLRKGRLEMVEKPGRKSKPKPEPEETAED